MNYLIENNVNLVSKSLAERTMRYVTSKYRVFVTFKIHGSKLNYSAYYIK